MSCQGTCSRQRVECTFGSGVLLERGQRLQSTRSRVSGCYRDRLIAMKNLVQNTNGVVKMCDRASISGDFHENGSRRNATKESEPASFTSSMRKGISSSNTNEEGNQLLQGGRESGSLSDEGRRELASLRRNIISSLVVPSFIIRGGRESAPSTSKVESASQRKRISSHDGKDGFQKVTTSYDRFVEQSIS